MLLEKTGEVTPERMKRLSQSRNNAQLWMCLMVKIKSDVVVLEKPVDSPLDSKEIQPVNSKGNQS